MHGDPAAAAPYWRYQQQDYDCGEMAVADVVGQITGHQPSEDEITAAAENIPSANHSGPIYTPASRTSNSDLPVLLAHYGIQAAAVHTNTDALMQDLDQGRKVIVGLNDKIIWNKPGDRTRGKPLRGCHRHRHRAGDGARQRQRRPGRPRRAGLHRHLRTAWGTSNNFAVVTR